MRSDLGCIGRRLTLGPCSGQTGWRGGGSRARISTFGGWLSRSRLLRGSTANVSRPVQFYTGATPHDFVVATVYGQEVWHWRCGKTFPAILVEISLEPGEELVLSGEWEQMDNWGEPVPAGTYLIRGMLIMEPADILATPPQELKVLK